MDGGRKREKTTEAAAGWGPDSCRFKPFSCLPYRDTGQLTHVHTELHTHATVKMWLLGGHSGNS